MASTANSFECNYLRSHTLPIPYVFSSEHAEIVHINERISSLDSHISQLNTLRCALKRRTCQLHNLRTPIHALPIETLSCIFQHVVSSEDYSYPHFERYRVCLGRALALSSVSTYFRHVAFHTPELWEGVSLRTTDGESIGRALSLLEHCTTLASHVNISVLDTLNEEQARFAAEVILPSHVTQKIKAFELHGSARGSNLWIENLRGPSFPILDTLDITCRAEDLCLDLRTLNTVTRVTLYEVDLSCPIIMPPSVQYLNLDDVPQQVVVDILYQCPNLEECFAGVESYFGDEEDAEFDEPLTLAHLKRLTLEAMDIISEESSAQNLRLPSLEYLRLKDYNESDFTNVVLLCGNVSSTLTTLDIHTISETVDFDELYQLCGLPFPNLIELALSSRYKQPLRRLIRALKLQADKHSKTKSQYFTSLTSLSLSCDSKMDPRYLLDLLKAWTVGMNSFFYIKAKCFRWSPELREELMSIVNNRQIEVTVETGLINNCG